MSDTNGNTGGGVDGGSGGWQPTPQGEFDADATAFVRIPEGFGLADFEEGGPSGTPLAAPGGYAPPHISVTGGAATDPAATSAFLVPGMGGAAEQPYAPEAVRWPEPNAPQPPAPEPTPPGATGQWSFTDATQAPDAPDAPDVSYGQMPDGFGGHHGQLPTGYESAPPAGYVPEDLAAYGNQGVGPAGHPQQGAYESGQGFGGYADQSDVTGQWSIPVAHGELPDESGEFSRSSLIEQWGGEAPATLPGGAPAPWATPEPMAEPVAEPMAEAVVEPVAEAVPEVGAEPVAEPAVAEVAPDADADAEGDGTAEAVVTDEGQDAADETAEVAAAEVAAAEAAATPEAAAPPLHHVTPDTQPDQPGALNDEHPLTSYVLRVNGADRPVTDAWIGESLLYVLRERLGLAGAKDGCSQGECGACAVQVDGRLVASCLVPAATTAGSEVRTVEGLAADGQPSDVQRALACGSAVQCGFCIPGMAMTVHDLLEGNPAPSEHETRQALCGNLCRCSGYRGVLDAVHDVVAERQASAEADAAADPKPAQGRDGTGTDGRGMDGMGVEAGPDGAARIPHQAPPGAGGAKTQHYAQQEQRNTPATPYDPTYDPAHEQAYQQPHEPPYQQPYDTRYDAPHDPQDGGAA